MINDQFSQSFISNCRLFSVLSYISTIFGMCLDRIWQKNNFWNQLEDVLNRSFTQLFWKLFQKINKFFQPICHLWNDWNSKLVVSNVSNDICKLSLHFHLTNSLILNKKWVTQLNNFQIFPSRFCDVFYCFFG